MFSHRAKFYLFLIYILYSCVTTEAIKSGNKSVTIYMNKQVKHENREIFGDVMKLQNYSTVEFNFDKLPNDTNFTFLVFQTHSFKDKITLYQNKKTKGNIVYGTNIGMVSIIKQREQKPKLTDVYYIENNNDDCLEIYVSVHVYYETDPYPGGCNNGYEVDIAPYLKVHTKKDYIEVDAAVASLDSKCVATYDNLSRFYMMYLPELRVNELQYFQGLKKMMTLEYIHEYGELIPQTSYEMRRTLSAYPGTGVIVVAVAMVKVNNGTAYSVYVPNHSYGCRNLDKDGCNKPHDLTTRVFRSGLLFTGLFVGYFGNRHFKTLMFLSGFFSGFIASYIAIAAMVGNTSLNQFGLTFIISGIVSGALWLLFCIMSKKRAAYVILPGMNVGLLIASMMYYAVPAFGQATEDERDFWSKVLLVVLLTISILTYLALSWVYSVLILCYAVLGSLLTVFGLDCCVQSNLEYIVFNIIRRAVVPKFRYAVIAPIIQTNERTMIITGIIFAIGGFLYQHLWFGEFSYFPRPGRAINKAWQQPNKKYGATNISIKITQKKRQEHGTLFNTVKTLKKYWMGRNMNQEKTPLISHA